MRIRNIRVGDDLSGKKLVFNFPKEVNDYSDLLYNYSVDQVILSSNGYYISYKRDTVSQTLEELTLYKPNGSYKAGLYYMKSWTIFNASKDYVLPEDFGTVVSVNINFNDYIKFEVEESIIYQGNEYVDVFNNEYKELCLKKIIHPKFKLQLLDSYENVIDEITEDISTDTSGSISVNYQQGVRRSISLSFIDTDGKFIPDSKGNLVWANKKFKVFIGLKNDDNGNIYWFSQGVYYFSNSSSSRNGADKKTTITGVDKFGKLGAELGYNQLESTYLIPAGTNIYSAIKGILTLDLGNGQPIDPIEPILDPIFKDEVCPYDISKAPSSYLSEILIELADILGCDIYYDNNGRLRVESGTLDISYSDRAAIWNFTDVLPEYMNPTSSVNFVNFINAVKVVGNNINDKIYEYTAYNNNPESPTRIDLIGQKMSYIESAAVYNEDRAKDYAKYKLNMLSILQLAINFYSTFLPHLDVNKIITISDKYFKYERQRFIIQSLSIPLVYSGTISISGCNIASLPYYEGGN